MTRSADGKLELSEFWKQRLTKMNEEEQKKIKTILAKVELDSAQSLVPQVFSGDHVNSKLVYEHSLFSD